MSCGTKILRTVLFAVNILVWLLGVALFAIGLYVFLDGKNYSELMDGGLFSASVVVIVVGFLIALIGFLGCCGAAKKNGCMLLLYSLCLLVIVIVQVVGVVIAFMFREDAKDYLEEGVTKSLAAYGGATNEEEAYTVTLDLAQKNFECCGMNKYDDYADKDLATIWVAGGNETSVPDSCCITNIPDCGKGQASSPDAAVIHEQGCLTKLEDFIHANLQLVGIVGAVFVVVEIFNLIVAFWLYTKFK